MVNATVKEDTFRPVFRNGLSNEPWNYGSLIRWFSGHLRRAKVRHRGPNQCRHTFASQMLSNYVSMEWVARQLGHTDTTMVKKHYGRWIQKGTPNMAGQVSEMLGYKADRSGLENAYSAPNTKKALTFLYKSGLYIGGERGIRTLDTLLTYTHFPGVRLQPLGHLS